MRGLTVAVTDIDGSVAPGGHLGVYHRDLRILSRVEIRIDGRTPVAMTARRDGADAAHHLFAVRVDAHGDPTAVLVRRRRIGPGLHDEYELRSFGRTVDPVVVEIRLATDFAVLERPALRERVVQAPVRYRQRQGVWAADGAVAGVDISVAGDGDDDDLAVRSDPDGTGWRWTVRPTSGQPSRLTVDAVPRWNGAPVVDDVLPPLPVPAIVPTDPRWSPTIRSAVSDLAALRMRVPDLDIAYISAGAPWFLAVFGRDGLLTAYNALTVSVEPALDVLETLAHHQGRNHVAARLEQPGRILHELRVGGHAVFGVPAGDPYYGTADATPLFVMVLAAAHRRGADPARIGALLPAARSAVAWCLGDGDPDDDGYVEYDSHAGGLRNQGWKDSANAMVHADGSQATGPFALCEVQAYVYRALCDLAELEEAVADGSGAGRLRERASALRAAFHRDFWLADRELIAMALDGAKRPLAVPSSNMGHCLWAGIVDPEVADRVIDRIAADDLLTSWGVRTLSSDNPAYNPLSYHAGSIWPHDTAIVAAGAARYGRHDIVERIAGALLDVGERNGWRLPELYGGIDRADIADVVPYPVACSPQAWSASAPLLLLRLLTPSAT